MSLRHGESGMHATIQSTCKDHKPRVTFRPIHGASLWCFSGIVRAVTIILDNRIIKFKHVVRSSDALLSFVTAMF